MLNVIKDNKGARYKYKRLGRGIGSGKGKTSARGGKGQTARSGVALNGFEGGQNPIHRRLPKRGFKNPFKTFYEVINLADVSLLVESRVLKSDIKLTDLFKIGAVKGKSAKVKLLGDGEVSAKFTIEVNAAAKTALTKAEKAGCKVVIIK